MSDSAATTPAFELLREAAGGWPTPNSYTDALDVLEEILPIARQIVKSNDVVTDPQASKPARASASMSEQEGIMVLAEWLVRIGATL